MARVFVTLVANCYTPFAFTFTVSDKRTTATKTVVSEGEVSSSENGSQQPPTSPSPSPSSAAAGSDARAEMVRLLHDTRLQVGQLRQRTENALAFVRQVSCCDAYHLTRSRGNLHVINTPTNTAILTLIAEYAAVSG